MIGRAGSARSRLTSNADHQGCPVTRKSTTCVVLMHGKHLLGFISKTQALVSLSSGESEWYALVKGAVEALYLKHFAEECQLPVKVMLLSDSSAARGVARRLGPGPRMKHLQANTLFVQQYIRSKELSLGTVGTLENLADLPSRSRRSGSKSCSRA